MKLYETPNMSLESLQMFESISCNDCWSHNNFIFNNPYDCWAPPKGNIPFSVNRDGKCNDCDSAIAIDLLRRKLSLGEQLLYVIQNFGRSASSTQWRGFEIVES